MSIGRRYRSGKVLTLMLGVLVIVGICLIIALMPGSPLRTPQVDTVALVWMPIFIGVVAYFRSNPDAKWWEIAGLLVWSFMTTNVVLFLVFFLVMDTSGGYPGAMQELINNLVQFISLSLSLGVLYGFAGKWWSKNRAGAMILILSAPVVEFILFALLGTVV